MDHAQHGAGWKFAADLEPRADLLARPTVHLDFTALAALPAPDEHGTAGTVKIALLQS